MNTQTKTRNNQYTEREKFQTSTWDPNKTEDSTRSSNIIPNPAKPMEEKPIGSGKNIPVSPDPETKPDSDQENAEYIF